MKHVTFTYTQAAIEAQLDRAVTRLAQAPNKTAKRFHREQVVRCFAALLRLLP